MEKIEFKQTDSDDVDFRDLVHHLDAELTQIYGEKQTFYSQFNALNHIHHVIVAYADGIAIGCGAIKKFSEESTEIKRMYVTPAFRNKGVAFAILQSLETWAKSLDYSSCVLETGHLQPDAIHLYKKAGYSIIPNYGPYQDDEVSICMLKNIVG